MNVKESIIIEIHACSGGDEAYIFMNEISKMYISYAQRNSLKAWINDSDRKVNSLLINIQGLDAYSRFKFESGVQRVQRVPNTEKNGRVHTSTISVAIIRNEEKKERLTDISKDDLRIDTYRSGGKGGQHVNKTDSAVRITHLPSGIVCECQEERSQIKNKEIAMKRLIQKLNDCISKEERDKLNDERRKQLGKGDISEHIRTYNFKQNRVTDHRYNISVNQLDKILNGNLDILLNKINLKNTKDNE